MEYKYMPISNRANFGSTRSRNSVRFLVLHWTANTGQGANATAHYRYFQNNRTYSSAHYFVDDKQIVQIVGDSTIAFAVGGNQGYGTALNGCINLYHSHKMSMDVRNIQGSCNQISTYLKTWIHCHK